MAAGDIYSLTVISSFLGQQLSNVFFYEATEDNPNPAVKGSAQLNEAFRTEVILDAWLGFTSSNMLITNINSYNLFDPTDFTNQNVSTLDMRGSATVGDDMPPYAAFKFSSTSLIRGVHGGQKRIGGMKEAQQTGGQIIPAAANALDLMADRLSGLLEFNPVTDGVLFRPVVLKRVKVPSTGLGSKTKYVLPTVKSEAVFYVAANWVASPIITTQNTRKFGRGK